MERTTCCVVGGGPAGLMLGLLLARAGIEVTVLEKHGDFLRDFRGDTVHPSTLQLLDELGLGERFATLPQSRLTEVGFPIDESQRTLVVGDFRRLSRVGVRHPYVAMVPQWDFLNLLADAAADEPTFHLRMRTEATELLRAEGRVTGVRHRTAAGETCMPTSRSPATAARRWPARRPGCRCASSRCRWTRGGSGCPATRAMPSPRCRPGWATAGSGS
jgi:2-polyprenyl-6-methoxyphenol hydroxylase-like FAD-dependent oxidoreductase